VETAEERIRYFLGASVKRPVNKRSSRGFTLIEVMIATVVLTVGLIAVAALFAAAIAASQQSLEDQIAKQKAREALEGVYSARNDTSLTFDSIQNVSNGGIFKDGFIPLNLACPPTGNCNTNGIVGTTSETTTPDRVVYPGPDGVLGTADDRFISLSNYRREIQITPIVQSGITNTDIREIVVTVRVFTAKRGARDYTVNGYISRFQ
jgi:prepilin-type N-terminal cleavage/methylation domain-containing protein